MQWEDVSLKFKQTNGAEDALGNPILSYYWHSGFKGRFTEFNQNDFQMLGYDTYVDSRKIIIYGFDRQSFPNLERIEVEGVEYKIDQYKDLKKYGLFYISKYR